MLKRELLIRRLLQGRGDDQDKLLARQQELEGLDDGALADRYRNELEDDPHNPSEKDPFLCSTEPINIEDCPGPLAVARMTLR